MSDSDDAPDLATPKWRAKFAQIVPLPKAECPFPVGTRVALLSGGVVMTVVDTIPPPKDGMPWAINGAWHDDVGCEHEATYPVTALQEWEEKPKKQTRQRKQYRGKKKPDVFEIVFTPEAK